MTIEWNPSAGPTLGVEWEVQLVDARTRMLRQDAGMVLAGLPGLLESGEHPKMRHELMQSTVEVVTGICGTVAEAKADLALSLKDLQRVAESQGLVLASSGTHAISHWRDGKMAPSQRYAELVQEIQWPSRRLQTMAVHVHVGLRDEHRAMPVVNALAVYLPHLLGLSASSPFWCGADTGLASTRSVVFGSLPHTGPPLGLPDWKSFEDYMAGQLRAGTIRTIKEVWWDIRPQVHRDCRTVDRAATATHPHPVRLTIGRRERQRRRGVRIHLLPRRLVRDRRRNADRHRRRVAVDRAAARGRRACSTNKLLRKKLRASPRRPRHAAAVSAQRGLVGLHGPAWRAPAILARPGRA